jgi:hypothetical protein
MAKRPFLSALLRREVARRARRLCEYCRLQQDLCPEPFETEHIIPRALNGPTELENLCLACPVCNNAKRDRIAARDEITGRRVRLFHPRLQDWDRHFRWSADFGTILGRTPVGRITVAALEMNHSRVVQIRLLWAALGLHPPR